jgi:hypothetical protein
MAMEVSAMTDPVVTSSPVRKWYLATFQGHEVLFMLRRPKCGALGHIFCDMTWFLAPSAEEQPW